MAFPWMGVGLDMSIREIAALVAAFKGISENAGPADGAPLTAGLLAPCLLAVDGWLGFAPTPFVPSPFVVAAFVPTPFVLTNEELPLRRALKHEGQYTGLPWLGLKGSVADLPQSSQTA